MSRNTPINYRTKPAKTKPFIDLAAFQLASHNLPEHEVNLCQEQRESWSIWLYGVTRHLKDSARSN